ncbi:sulfate adenylyltransferase subunit CysN [Flammeovirga kamogawensis]|uniref:sulfate adenylyltransferase n=1 Tax=Flammeovirga kamogawensis TaxID=373891 RepID=A0ABX8GWU7_9BACT|nr:sulfate adenylyltransferase subunit CysN [Flammeovirga kamogawensis]MBB6461659.1 sulfate adenylyltransferase subunit 1 [Flammeovirga kamogawensis]QWG07415.1 sulfate adenylyltransferase subunit CysN [Flammeovirga kamogawensis]TRX69226.1 sulfate adenylyltransferase subunit CysN [Flammeovirga kamogawensis]
MSESVLNNPSIKREDNAAAVDQSYMDMDLLRFTTAGSVDDGKSTLIGRLMYDTKSIFEDQLEAIEKSSKSRGDENVNLALLTDGLKAEREQGITIDVAYRYFATPKRKFIIADTPGHIQYTRNMVTGASTANLAIVLVDARNGVIEQTRRHTFIASLLKIKHIVVAVNKMDLVDYSEEQFNKIKTDFLAMSDKIGIEDIRFIPISALKGDNVVDDSERTPWYKGGALLSNLEAVEIDEDHDLVNGRFPVQRVITPEKSEFKGFAGRVDGGILKVGDAVVALPSGAKSTIKSIETMDGKLEEAFPPMSVVLTLEDNITVERGDMLVKADNLPEKATEITATLCWMNQNSLKAGATYILRHTSNEVNAEIKSIDEKLDINTMQNISETTELKMNEIGKVVITTESPIFVDKYKKNRATGSLILIDKETNETVAAGMIS